MTREELNRLSNISSTGNELTSKIDSLKETKAFFEENASNCHLIHKEKFKNKELQCVNEIPFINVAADLKDCILSVLDKQIDDLEKELESLES